MENSSSSKGKKRKRPIELIANGGRLQVAFSKRRTGLFKKAYELSTLCGAHVGVLAFSPAGNPYTYVSPPGSSSILSRFLPSSQQTGHDVLPNSVADLNRQVSDLNAKIEASKRKNESLKAARKSMPSADLAKADLAQLEARKKDLERVEILSLSEGVVSINMLLVNPASESDVAILPNEEFMVEERPGSSNVPNGGLTAEVASLSESLGTNRGSTATADVAPIPGARKGKRENVPSADLAKADLAQLEARKKDLERVEILSLSAGDVSINMLPMNPASESDVAILPNEEFMFATRRASSNVPNGGLTAEVASLSECLGTNRGSTATADVAPIPGAVWSEEDYMDMDEEIRAILFSV